MDKKDAEILAALQKDGRLSNVDLAAKVALSPSPCFRRVRRLEEDGIVTGYRAVLDRKKAGLGLTVFVEIKVAQHSADNAERLQAALDHMPEVITCHMVSGAADFLAEIAVADLDAYERLLSEKLLTLPMVQDIRSNFSLRRIKSEAPLPVEAGR